MHAAAGAACLHGAGAKCSPGAGVNIDDRAYMWQKSCVALDAFRPLISLLHWQGHWLCHGACVEKKVGNFRPARRNDMIY